MAHPLERIRQMGETTGLWEHQTAHWSFNEARNRRQRARNLRHIKRREDRQAVVTGLLIFVAATGEVPSKQDIKAVLTPGGGERATAKRHSISQSELNALL